MERKEDIYVNQGFTSKQRAKKKETPAGAPRFRDDDEPDYENISVISRSQNGALEQQSMPIQWAAPAPSKSSGPSLGHKSVLCLYFLLSLSFLMCIILLSLIVVKSSEFSEKLIVMKNEFWNVSRILQENRKQLESQITHLETIRNFCMQTLNQQNKNLKKMTEDLKLLTNRVKTLEDIKSGFNRNSTG